MTAPTLTEANGRTRPEVAKEAARADWLHEAEAGRFHSGAEIARRHNARTGDNLSEEWGRQRRVEAEQLFGSSRAAATEPPASERSLPPGTSQPRTNGVPVPPVQPVHQPQPAQTPPVGNPNGAGQAVKKPAESPKTRTAVRWVTGLVVLGLGVIALAVSYSHMHDLAVLAGEGAWQAAMLPATVEGMVLSASLTMLTRRMAGRGAGWLSWICLIVGIVVSVAANVTSAEPRLVSQLMAAWPPLAFWGAYELFVQQLTGRKRDQ